jgi:sugar phosphate isomerase/epimerase
MDLGIFARTFARPGLEAALDAVAASGIASIQFNLSLTGGPSLPPEIPPVLAERIRAAVAARGLTMAAVSGTYNMAHPDPAVRADGGMRLATLIAAAPGLGTRVVTLCTGTRDPGDMWRAHPDNGTPEAWEDSVEQIAAALRTAERHDVVLAFEPEHGNVVADARAGRRLLDELRSPHLKVVVDAANLIRPGELDRQEETLRAAFALLGDDLVLAHAKDVRADGTIVPAGLGGLDYRLYAGLLRDAGYAGPLVLHGLPEERVPASAAYVREHLDPGQEGHDGVERV